MRRTAVINVVGLTDSLLGRDTPRMNQFAQTGQKVRIEPALPALTCTAQANYLTGVPPSQHGIVGNGWYDKSLADVQFWKQSNHLVQAPKIYDALRKKIPGFTCAKLFWWYNMYSGVDYSITPRPLYPADGRKIFDVYTWPYSIGPLIKRDLGDFPFPTFWGPAAGRNSRLGTADAVSQWIAQSAIWMETRHEPTLSLVYLPHLDYNLQRLGPHHADLKTDLTAIDRIVGQLLDFYQTRNVQPLIISEYGITPVDSVVYPNRLFRQQGWITIKEELGLEKLDGGASRVFAVADHQVAHVYLNDPSLEHKVRACLENEPGIARVLGAKEKTALGLNHARAGDLIALATENAWFAYYFWLNDALAPDYARCVDIHRKPGYDPVELFLDPNLKFPQANILWRLLKKKLGMRMLMDLIPLDATLVKGSHGVAPQDPSQWPILLAGPDSSISSPTLSSCDVRDVMEKQILARS